MINLGDINKKIKYLEKLLQEIKYCSKNSKEDRYGECSEDRYEFWAGIIEENELIKEEILPQSDSIFRTEWRFSQCQSKRLEKTFPGKIIVGWKLKSNHENGLGGFWERKSEVLGTSSYSFVVNSYRSRGCDWKLRIWTVNNVLPPDIL